MTKIHIKIIAALYIVTGMLGTATTMYVFFSCAMHIHMMAGLVLSALYFFFFVFPLILGGWALWHRMPWSRMLVIALGVINVFTFPIDAPLATVLIIMGAEDSFRYPLELPIGTFLGIFLFIYTLWILLKPEAKEYLKAS